MKNTRFISILVVIILIISLLSACGNEKDVSLGDTQQSSKYEYVFRELSAPKYIEPATSFAGGDGSDINPYQISSAEELAFMQVALSGENKSDYEKSYFVLINDIELNSVENFENWKNTAPEFSWKSIENNLFKGVFDGNGYTVRGMYINVNKDDTDSSSYGLFGNIGGTIKNLTIEKSYIAVSGYSANVGVIAGNLTEGSKIDNCTSGCEIECYENICGGIVGQNGGEIINCVFNGNIKQMQNGSNTRIGGIVGDNSGNVVSCKNTGTVVFGPDNVDAVGGITGYTDRGIIKDCVNNGNLNGEISDESALAISGGIIGKIFMSNVGGENISTGVEVSNCVNNGTVCADYYAGGVIGELNNDRNPNCITVKNCKNNGEVNSSEYSGGVIGAMTCNSPKSGNDNIFVENCVNNAQLKTGTVGGVIGFFRSNKGQVTISRCVNNADLSTTVQNCAGILGYWLMDSCPSAVITVKDCKNIGDITSPLNAGGIFSYADAPVLLEDSDGCLIDIINCSNSGDITTLSNNSYIGGISANWGMRGISADFINCFNSGNLIIDNDNKANGYTDEDGNKIMTISRIAGGIIGRVGDGLLLTTDSDKVKDKNINSKKAVVTLNKCSNIGKLEVNDSNEYTDANGEKVYKNYFGGLVGNTSGEKDVSLFVENCTYSNFERGIGNTEVKDIGTKK